MFLYWSMGLTVKVTNMDYMGLYYDHVKVGISYQDKKIGWVTSEKSTYIPPRGTTYVDATLDVHGIQVLVVRHLTAVIFACCQLFSQNSLTESREKTSRWSFEPVSFPWKTCNR